SYLNPVIFKSCSMIATQKGADMVRSRLFLALAAALALCLMTPTPGTARSHGRVVNAKLCIFLTCGPLFCGTPAEVAEAESTYCANCEAVGDPPRWGQLGQSLEVEPHLRVDQQAVRLPVCSLRSSSHSIGLPRSDPPIVPSAARAGGQRS